MQQKWRICSGKSVDSIHFDEAWYGYARFNPLYRERFAMRDGVRDKNGPTVFATQSTHKLLAALSQASMIHVRNGRVPIEHSRFNEGFMMHSSTSPLYPIIASLDVSSKMMDGPSGRLLTTESIEEAIRFRRTMARIAEGRRDREDQSRLVVPHVAAGNDHRPEDQEEGRVCRCIDRNAPGALPPAGCCTRARNGTGLTACRTITACSTRSRSPCSRRASTRTARSRRGGSRRQLS